MPRANSRSDRARGKTPGRAPAGAQTPAAASAATQRALHRLVAPIVVANGCDLEDIVVRVAGRRRLVRIVVDHPDGLPLDLVAQLSRAVSSALDATELLGEAPYVLEVSSPGVDRPLRLVRHWRASIGRLVDITTSSGESLQARVKAVDESDPDAPTIILAGARGPQPMPMSLITTARVQVEFAQLDAVDLDSAQALADVAGPTEPNDPDAGAPHLDLQPDPAGRAEGDPAVPVHEAVEEDDVAVAGPRGRPGPPRHSASGARVDRGPRAPEAASDQPPGPDPR